MAISPQYSNPWKVIPFSRDDQLTEDNEFYVTWNESLKCYSDSTSPGWDIVCAVFSLSLANHIATMHNEWYDNWYHSLPYEDEVAPGFCGNTRPRQNMTASEFTEAVIEAFGGYYPLKSENENMA